RRDAAVGGSLVDERHRGAGHELARLIDDGTGDAAGDRLRRGGRGAREERDEEGEQQTANGDGHRTSCAISSIRANCTVKVKACPIAGERLQLARPVGNRFVRSVEMFAVSWEG